MSNKPLNYIPQTIDSWRKRLPIFCGPWWKFESHDWGVTIPTGDLGNTVPEFCCHKCGYITSNNKLVEDFCTKKERIIQQKKLKDEEDREIAYGKHLVTKRAVGGDMRDIELINKIRSDKSVALLNCKHKNAYIRSIAKAVIDG
jgi:hypothetical protein